MVLIENRRKISFSELGYHRIDHFAVVLANHQQRFRKRYHHRLVKVSQEASSRENIPLVNMIQNCLLFVRISHNEVLIAHYRSYLMLKRHLFG